MPRVTRRTLLTASLAAAALPHATPVRPAHADTKGTTGATGTNGTPLHWRDGRPAETAGGSAWGVPWPRGTLAPHTPLALTAGDGTPVPVQSWPLAYWPDGSVKWTGHAIGAGGEKDTYVVAP